MRDAKKAAQSAIEGLEKDIENNAHVEFEGITFKDFCKAYLEHSKLYSEYKTIESAESTIKKFSKLSNIELAKITTLDIQNIVDGFVKEGLKTNTIKLYLKKLTAIFNYAKNQYNLIQIVPSHKIVVGKMNEIHKKALNDNEVADLLNKVEKYENVKYFLLIFIAVNTGMRLGEILGLKWNDIDFKNGYINVNKQFKHLKNGEYGIGKLKTRNSKRTIPVSHVFCSKLLQYKKIISIDERIIQCKNKNIIDAQTNRILKKYGYNISVHELRHTYATKLIANGMDFKTVAKILGHDVKQTIETYSHVNSDMMNKAKNLIENIF